jgi:glycosyltransferase involved in cell wall biosynthesis
MKISVLMPAFNDALCIKGSIESLLKQSYTNWELIVINDGSTDNTEEVILSIKDDRIKYVYQDNADQLNALLRGSEYVTGDLVCMLHSDDYLPSDIFEYSVSEFKKSDIDGLYGDIQMFGGNCKKKSLKHVKLKPFLQYCSYVLFGSGNLIYDHFFVTKEKFLNNIVPNYIRWNKNYWIDYKNQDSLNLKYSGRVMYNYRIPEGDNRYLTSEIGRLNRLNGNLRIIKELSRYYYIPMFPLQKFIYRMLMKMKIARFFPFFPFYKRKGTNGNEFLTPLMSLLKFRGYDRDTDNKYIKALIDFYSNFKDREINLGIHIKEEDAFYGKDMRRFNNLLLKDSLPELYNKIFEECKTGFNTILVEKEGNQKELFETVFNFLCLDVKVKELS